MIGNLGLQCLSGIFVLQTVIRNLEPRLPIACVWEVGTRGGPRGNAAISIAGTIAVIAGNVVVFVLSTWYLHSKQNPRWMKSVQVVGLAMLVAMGIGATVRVVMESSAFGKPPEEVRLQGNGEREWSYGQLLPLLLLVLPLVSALEIVRGEVKVPKKRGEDEEEEVMPLVEQLRK